jgi:DNA-repair protein complementing XP-A cells
MSNSDENLTAEQLERIERNRQRALQLRASSTKNYESQVKTSTTATPSASTRKQQIDSHAGFFLDDDPKTLDHRPITYETVSIIHQPKSDQLDVLGMPCEECQMIFLASYLHKNFNEPICDTCREKYSINDERDDCDDEQAIRYSLITRTSAKDKYLLTDYDLDKREPKLKCIEKKNPHNQHWGIMRLYLRCQIQRLSNEIHQGKTDEKLLEREEKKAENKRKKYEKQVEKLRLDVRTSLQTKRIKTVHEHIYDEKNIQYDEQTDMHTKTCLECGYQYQYEEM